MIYRTQAEKDTAKEYYEEFHLYLWYSVDDPNIIMGSRRYGRSKWDLMQLRDRGYVWSFVSEGKRYWVEKTVDYEDAFTFVKAYHDGKTEKVCTLK